MAAHKWTEERTASLVSYVGDETPVSRGTVDGAADQLEVSARSIASKLRKMEYDVEKASTPASKFSTTQEATLRAFIEDNPNTFTYAEIASAFEDGDFSPKQIQGKVLSMQLTELVNPAPAPESVKTFTDAQEETFVSMANGGSCIEEIADALGVEVNRARGKALSLLRSGDISAIPTQRDKKGSTRVDPLAAIENIGEMTVVQIAEAIEKSPRGVKTMLTRRGLTAADYDGAAKKEKAAG